MTVFHPMDSDAVKAKRVEVNDNYAKYGFHSQEYQKSWEELHVMTMQAMAAQFRTERGLPPDAKTPYDERPVPAAPIHAQTVIETQAGPASRRPSREAAEAAIRKFLDKEVPGYPELNMCEDGDEDSAEGKCGWAFWIASQDTTSYLHENLSIEWYGSEWPEHLAYDSETGEFKEVEAERRRKNRP